MKPCQKRFLSHVLLLVLISLIPLITITAKQEYIRISIWTINQPGPDPVGNWIEGKISQFEKANPNIVIVHNFWENQSYKIKLKVAMLVATAPIFYIIGVERAS